MAAKSLIIGNWKMNLTHLEAIAVTQKLWYRLDPADFDRAEVVIAPPFTCLRTVQTLIMADRMPFGLGAQQCSLGKRRRIHRRGIGRHARQTGCRLRDRRAFGTARHVLEKPTSWSESGCGRCWPRG